MPSALCEVWAQVGGSRGRIGEVPAREDCGGDDDGDDDDDDGVNGDDDDHPFKAFTVELEV